jgi:dTDP-4-dehydrorhamnose reductase
MSETARSKIMITGAAGLLGQALIPQFLHRYDVIAITHSSELENPPPGLKIEKADLSENAQVKRLLAEYSPEIILNAAGWVDVDGCESDRKHALKSNYTIVQNLVDEGKSKNSYIIQISTDYIFNGVDHPATIEDSPAPLNYYGKTKLMAEEYLIDRYARYLISRTCALVGYPNKGQTNLLNYFYDGLKAGKTIEVPNDIYSNPIWVKNLAELLLEAVDKGLKGIVHLAGKDYLSRYEFAGIFADVYSFDRSLIKPVPSIHHPRPAKRPQHAGLNIDQTIDKFETPILSAREMLSRIKAESE